MRHTRQTHGYNLQAFLTEGSCLPSFFLPLVRALKRDPCYAVWAKATVLHILLSVIRRFMEAIVDAM